MAAVNVSLYIIIVQIIFYFLWDHGSILVIFKNRIPLKPALGAVCSLSNYSVAYEETQSNRVSDFRDFVCSLFPKAILFYFYLSIKEKTMLVPWSVIKLVSSRKLQKCIVVYHVSFSIAGLITYLGRRPSEHMSLNYFYFIR